VSLVRSLLATALALPLTLGAQPRVSVTLPATRAPSPQDGRLLLLLSADSSAEPRFQIQFGAKTQLVFGSDVDGWAPGTARAVPGDAFGFPIRSLKDVPAGTYRVQAFLNRYETFRLADGRVLKLVEAGQSLQHAAHDPLGSGAAGFNCTLARQRDPGAARPRAEGNEVREVREDPQ
jgi:hypothetical protein